MDFLFVITQRNKGTAIPFDTSLLQKLATKGNIRTLTAPSAIIFYTSMHHNDGTVKIGFDHWRFWSAQARQKSLCHLVNWRKQYTGSSFGSFDSNCWEKRSKSSLVLTSSKCTTKLLKQRRQILLKKEKVAHLKTVGLVSWAASSCHKEYSISRRHRQPRHFVWDPKPSHFRLITNTVLEVTFLAFFVIFENQQICLPSLLVKKHWSRTEKYTARTHTKISPMQNNKLALHVQNGDAHKRTWWNLSLSSVWVGSCLRACTFIFNHCTAINEKKASHFWLSGQWDFWFGGSVITQEEKKGNKI